MQIKHWLISQFYSYFLWQTLTHQSVQQSHIKYEQSLKWWGQSFQLLWAQSSSYDLIAGALDAAAPSTRLWGAANQEKSCLKWRERELKETVSDRMDGVCTQALYNIDKYVKFLIMDAGPETGQTGDL